MLCLYGRAQQTVLLNGISEYELDSSVQYLMDTSRLTPTEVLKKFDARQGRLLPKNYFGVPLQNSFCWLYLRLQNNDVAKRLIFRLKRHDIYHFEAFKKGQSNIDTLFIGGDAYPFSRRSILVGDLCFRVQMAPHEQAELVILMDKRGETLNSFFVLQEESYFYRQIRQDYQGVFFYLGVVFFIFIFNLFLWAKLRDSVHLYYLLNLSAGAANVVGNFGLSLEYLWPNLTHRTSIINTCFLILFLASNLLFMSKFLNLKNHSKFEPYVRYFTYLLFGWLVSTLPVLWFKIVDLPHWVVTGYVYIILFYLIITILLIVSVCIEQWYQKNPYIQIYSLALLVMISFAIAYQLSVAFNGFWIKPADFIIWANLLEVTILAFGLTIRYNTYKQQNHSLLLELSQAQNKLLTTQLNAQESERQRIAADLHDDLGGTLSTIRRRITDIRMNLKDPKAAQDFELLEPLIQKSTDDLRRISHNLMPPEFAHLGLANALKQFIQVIPQSPTHFEFLISGEERKLSMDIELNLYRIVSELVQNILKHAQATKAAVQLIYFDDLLTITVEDNGIGNRLINKSSEIPEVSSGIGLKNSKLRAEYISAKLRIETSAGGTLVILEIPYPPIENDARPHKNTSD